MSARLPDPPPSGLNATGYGQGFDLHTSLLGHPRKQLDLRFAYDYPSTRGIALTSYPILSDTSVKSVLMWCWQRLSRFSFPTGANLTWLDGEQRVSDNINQVIPFA